MSEFANSVKSSKGQDAKPDAKSLPGAALQPMVLDAAADALGTAFFIFDQNDTIIYASRNVRQFFPIAPELLEAGTRLRDLFGALYDAGASDTSDGPPGRSMGRDEWVASHIASHWRERGDDQLRDASGRWLRYSRRRLSSGHGLSMVQDITEQKKREDQWRADMERVQLTEEILDNLPNPVFVQDARLMVVAVNLAFADLLSLTPDSLLGKAVDQVFRPDVAEQMMDAARHTLQAGTPSVIALEIAAVAPVLIRTKRVGKPGRYFIVTTIDDLAELHDLLPAAGAAATAGRREQRPANHAPHYGEQSGKRDRPTAVPGLKVVVVTADHGVESVTLKTLAEMGADGCAVRSINEEEAFFRLARSSATPIDLVLIDAQMDIACLELAEMQGLDVLALDAFQLTGELQQCLGHHLSTKAMTAEPKPDWQMEPERKETVEFEEPERPLILVAEDDEINKVVFAQILESMGVDYKIASRGDEAVRMWREFQPDMVLMDITLPVMSGLEASRIIRELGGRLGAQTPIIGVVVDPTGDARKKCLEAGMNDTIMKPLSTEMLDDVFKRFLKTASGCRF